MTEPTYLYSSSWRVKHIADGDNPPDGAGGHLSLCGRGFETEGEMRDFYRQYASVSRTAQLMHRKRSLPVCKRCEKKAADHG